MLGFHAHSFQGHCWVTTLIYLYWVFCEKEEKGCGSPSYCATGELKRAITGLVKFGGRDLVAPFFEIRRSLLPLSEFLSGSWYLRNDDVHAFQGQARNECRSEYGDLSEGCIEGAQVAHWQIEVEI